jgi:hypothetical protein
MASPIASHAAMTRTAFIRGPVVDAITNRTPFYAALKRRGKIKFRQGGLTIRPPAIRYKNPSVQGWDGRNQLQVVELDLHAYAEHGWVGYVHNYIDNKYDQLENQGPEALHDEDEANAEAVEQMWVNHFDDVLFDNGTSSTPVALSGLESFMKITGTYGGLSQAAQDANSLYWWGPTVINGTTALTPRTFKTDPKAYLKNLANTIGNRGVSSSLSNEAGPDFGITTQTIWEHIASYYEEKARIPMTVSTETVGMNARMIRAEGMDIYWSSSCPASTFYALSMKDLTMYLQTGEWFVTRDLQIADPIGELHQTYFKGQLVTNNPRAHGKITNISV